MPTDPTTQRPEDAVAGPEAAAGGGTVPPTVRRRVGVAAAVLVVAAVLAVALDGPAWLATTLTAIAALATALPSARTRLGWVDALVTSAAGLVVVLLLLGFLLDVFPGGLARVSWGIGAGVLALLAIAWGTFRPVNRTSLPLDLGRSLRLVPAYAVGAGLAAVALIISVHATDVANRAPVALSLLRHDKGSATLQVQGGHAARRLELVVVGPRGGSQVYGPFSVPGDGQVERTVRLPRGRSMIELRAPHDTRSLRSLTVAAADAGDA